MNNNSRGYKRFYWDDGSYSYEHVLLATKALGRPLKFPEQVHHLDGNGLNNDPSNLVVCPDMAYHMLLHVRSKPK